MKIGNHILTWTWGNIRLSKNKSFEYQFEGSSFADNDLFVCNLTWSIKSDHAGPSFTFSIYKLFWININIHDHRHWNYKNNDWESPNDCGYETGGWKDVD
jgi:hypothetical protein